VSTVLFIQALRNQSNLFPTAIGTLMCSYFSKNIVVKYSVCEKQNSRNVDEIKESEERRIRKMEEQIQNAYTITKKY
jgi:hypothetical protein